MTPNTSSLLVAAELPLIAASTLSAVARDAIEKPRGVIHRRIKPTLLAVIHLDQGDGVVAATTAAAASAR